MTIKEKHPIIFKSTMLLLCLTIFITVFASPGWGTEKSHRMNPVKKNSLYRTMNVAKTDLNRVKDREIMLKLNDATDVGRMDWARLGLIVQSTPATLARRGIVTAKIPASEDFDRKISELKSNPLFRSVDPNYIVESSSVPDDEFYPAQWYLNQINMPAAWDLAQGKPDIIVAVLDTGVDYNHPDLAGRIWTNPAEIENGVDDDGNGYIDDIHGFCTNTPADSQHPYDPMDDKGHGTMTAGIIGAISNNHTGISGMDWNCRILPVKVLDTYGAGSTQSVVAGIYYAIDQGADIINMSYGCSESNQAESDAVWDAFEAGITLVASSGNDNGEVCYPAAYLPVIAVGSTGPDDAVSYFSNYGNRLDLAAPGENILSTSQGAYFSGDGTSFSAPIISGIAALLKGQNRIVTPSVLEWRLERSTWQPAAYAGKVWNRYYGYGRIDALAALTQTLPDLSLDTPNEKANALPLNINRVYEQTLEMPLDDDWYCFEVEYRSETTIAFSAPANLDIVAGLERSDDQIAAWPPQTIDAQPAGGNETLTLTLDPGTYYLDIYDYDGHWSNEPYQLTVSYYIPAAALTLSQHNLSLTAGGPAANLTAAISPENVSDSTVIWDSSRSEVASVVDGAITPLAVGDTVITARTNDGQSDSCAVSVAAAGTEAQNNSTDACFIATAAYGSFLDPHVTALRQFRDQVLLKTHAGQWFVKQYYHYSPPVARVIAHNEGLRWLTRILLTPLVMTVEYPIGALALILILFSVLLVRKTAAGK